MQSWPAPDVPPSTATGPPVRLHDTATGELVTADPDGPARLYVCGITPYDATHLGHAATYLAFDLLYRAWLSAGHQVRYAQNVTDVDDPLLERAAAVGVDWQDLASRETALFRDDMAALRVLPPHHFTTAVEAMDDVVALVQRLQQAGAVYAVEDDLYFSVNADPAFGEVSGLDRETMVRLFGERGGDPDRPGKRDPLDCLVWRAERDDEPAWDSPLGRGRPGWHVECTAIATHHLGGAFDVQGGGSDLVFPHHEMCAAGAQVADPEHRFARAYVHGGMVGYDGAKMSKSRGNMVFISQLRHSEVDPMAIRLAVLRHHYREDWEWTDDQVVAAADTLHLLRKALSVGAGAPAAPVGEGVLAALADDLASPRALRLVEQWAADTLGTTGLADTSDPEAGERIRALLDGALGLAL